MEQLLKEGNGQRPDLAVLFHENHHGLIQDFLNGNGHNVIVVVVHEQIADLQLAIGQESTPIKIDEILCLEHELDDSVFYIVVYEFVVDDVDVGRDKVGNILEILQAEVGLDVEKLFENGLFLV